MTTEDDPFDTLLSLEDDFYKEGYDLGISDGDHAGRVEGRLFGLEKGFEKFVAMGRLHGKSTVWAGRLPDASLGSGATGREEDGATTKAALHVFGEYEDVKSSQPASDASLLPANPRLEAHVRTLYALTESSSLSTENSEKSISDFDDRLRRAKGKVKILEKLIGEPSLDEAIDKDSSDASTRKMQKSKGEGSIEDVSSLHARH